MMRADRVERFHATIIEEIGKEAPVVAERLAMRLAQLACNGRPDTHVAARDGRDREGRSFILH
jgi:hypothetical protein